MPRITWTTNEGKDGERYVPQATFTVDGRYLCSMSLTCPGYSGTQEDRDREEALMILMAHALEKVAGSLATLTMQPEKKVRKE